MGTAAATRKHTKPARSLPALSFTNCAFAVGYRAARKRVGCTSLGSARTCLRHRGLCVTIRLQPYERNDVCAYLLPELQFLKSLQRRHVQHSDIARAGTLSQAVPLA